MTEKKIELSYEEHKAVAVIRRSMLKKPEILGLLIKDAPQQEAGALLVQAKVMLDQLLEVNRAFIAATGYLAKKENPNGQPD